MWGRGEKVIKDGGETDKKKGREQTMHRCKDQTSSIMVIPDTALLIFIISYKDKSTGYMSL